MLVVNQALPSVAVNGPINITYGTPLTNSLLSGTASWTVNGSNVTVPGTFSFTSAIGTLLSAGNGQSVSVTFTPTDSTDFATVATTVTVNVAALQPTVTISGPSSSVYGQSVAFTVAVNPPNGGIATGSVVFFDGSKQIATATLSNGIASIASNTLTVGSHTITAQYLGDKNFGSASSTTSIPLTVARDSTSLAIVSSASPMPLGQAVTFTAQVSAAAPGTLIPGTGTVQFLIDGKAVGFPAVVNGGVATFTTSSLGFGTHSVSATYTDNASTYLGSTGALAAFQVISSAQTSTSLSANASSAVYSQSVRFTAGVSGIGSTSTPTGSVQFYVDNALAATIALSSGTASFSTSTLAVGSSPHAVFANYVPSGTFVSSTSAAKAVAVAQAATTTTVSSSVASASPGQTVTITATVAAKSPATAAPTSGTVNFYLDGGSTVWQTATLSSGSLASVSVSTLPAGSHTISAMYAATANFATSSATTPASITINPAATSITLSPVTSKTTYGTAVTLTASVTSPDKAIALTGQVQFFDNGTALGAAVAVTGGTATLNLNSVALDAGKHVITATFLGSTNFLASGPTAAQTITVSPAATNVSASSKSNGSTVTISGSVADVAGAPASQFAPTGVIKIMNGSVVLATITLDASGSFTTALTLPKGNNNITILYVPDTNVQGQSNFSSSSTSLKIKI